MAYRFNDAGFMKPKKEYLYENDEDPDYSWGFFRKNVYLDDLFEYTRSLYPNNEIEKGSGNLNTNIVFVVDSMKSKGTLDLLRLVLSKVNIKFTDIYVTSYFKVPTNTGRTATIDDLLSREIKAIKPKAVFSIGDYGIKADGFDLSMIDIDTVDKITSMDKQFNKSLVKDLSEDEQDELKKYKSAFFKCIKYLIRFMLI